MSRYPSLAGRRRFLVAASASASFFIVAGVLSVVASAVSWAMFAFQQNGIFDPRFTLQLGVLFVTSLPFALGVFLSLWLVAPVAGELRIKQVISRSLLAVVIGAAVYFVVQFAFAVIGQWSDSDGRVFGFFVGGFRSLERSLDQAPLDAIYIAFSQAIALLPLTVLAGVLTWVWLQKHPHTLQASVPIDEV